MFKVESKNSLLSIKEVMTEFKLTRYTVYTLIKTDPSFPCLKVGPRKNYRIPSHLLSMWLEQRFKERHYYEFKVPTADQLFKIGRL